MISPVLEKSKPLLVPLPSLAIPSHRLLPFAAAHLKALSYPLPPVLVPSRADPKWGLLHCSKTATSLITFNFYIDKFNGQFLLSVDCPPFEILSQFDFQNTTLSCLSFYLSGYSLLTFFPEPSSSSLPNIMLEFLESNLHTALR